MINLHGEYECKIDAKGRLIIPAALKKQLPMEAKDSFFIKKYFILTMDIFVSFSDCLYWLNVERDNLIKTLKNTYKEGIDYFECELVMYIVKDSCLIEISKITKYINIKLDKDYAESVEKHYCGGYD